MSEVLTLDPKTIMPFSSNPRRRFRGILQLAMSIRIAGQTTPILVTKVDPPMDGYEYELTDGERRLKACLEYNMKILAVISDADDKDKFAQAVAANFCRQKHDAMEVADAIARLRSDGRTLDEIATIMGKSGTWVAQHISLRRLCPEVQELLKPDDAGKTRLAYSVALLMVAIDPSLQMQMAAWILKTNPTMAAARNYVQRLCVEHPELDKARKGARDRGPREQFKVLTNAVNHVGNVFERYSTMSHAELVALIEVEHGEKLRALQQRLRLAIADLTGIAAEVDRVQARREDAA